jgi:uncharacterized protein (TIGR02246 family)
MLRKIFCLFILPLAFTAGACAAPPAPVDTTADVAAVSAVAEAWAAAYNAGDAAAVAALYSADAVFMRNHQPALEGQAAVQTAMEEQMAAMTTMINVMPDQTLVMGDTAVGTGTFTMTLTPKAEGAAPINDEGGYMVVMQRQADGVWKIWRQIGNSAMPMPMAPMADDGAM